MQGWRTTSPRGSRSAFERGLSGGLSALLFAGCSSLGACEDRPIVYVDIRDRVSDAPEQAGKIERPVLEASLSEAMKRWPGYRFRKAKASETGWQLNATVQQLTARVADAPSGGAIDPSLLRRSLGLTLELQSTADRKRYTADAIEIETAKLGTPLDELVRRTVLKAADDMRLALELEGASEAELLALLGASDPAHQARAITIAADRKLAAARVPLEKLVKDPAVSEELALRAVGALLALRDPASASALIDGAHDRGPEIQRQVVFALGQLGGKEAEAYLFTVQSGHPDPAMRAAATEALQDLAKPDGPSAPAP